MISDRSDISDSSDRIDNSDSRNSSDTSDSSNSSDNSDISDTVTSLIYKLTLHLQINIKSGFSFAVLKMSDIAKTEFDVVAVSYINC